MNKNKIIISGLTILVIVIIVITLVLNKKSKVETNTENTTSENGSGNTISEKYNENTQVYELYSSDGENLGTYYNQEDLDIAKQFYEE